MNRRRLNAFIATFFALSLASCSFDPGASVETCFDENDCRTGRICYLGACVDRIPVADMTAPDMSSNNDQPDAADFGVPDAGIDMPADSGDDVSVENCGVDADQDTFFSGGPNCMLPAAQLDCNDGNPDVFPGAATRCNGEDNNCDGVPDTEGCDCIDGFLSSCGSSVGLCTPGTRECVDGTWGDCMGDVRPSPELCDGQDNNCDGTSDEGCTCSPGDIKDCGTDVGECASGQQTCVNGQWSLCLGGQGAVVEICDGKDNDCDGAPDNNLVDEGAGCATGELGICAAGAEACVGGTLVCQRVNDPTTEVCNGNDDNCNGLTDENIIQACSTACGAGEEVCSNGTFVDCTPNNPPAEICDGVDNNCDNAVDESFPEDGDSCDTGLSGICAAGARACSMGGLICVPTQPSAPEICDGIDNDCDGMVDEDSSGLVLTEACGNACPQRSVRVCLGGAWSSCERSDMEVCDSTDTNCDGVADNPAVCYRACPGGGTAVGTLSCGPQATCTLPAEICGDSVDNDCDGAVDEADCDASFDDMVFIPGGTFLMGAASSDPVAQADELPLHVVELDAFYIDRHEVTRSDYTACVIAGGCSLPPFGCPLQPTVTQGDKPVACIDWSQSNDYCQWKGKRLPTEAEWEKTARGPFPRVPLFPWGNLIDPSRAVMGCTQSQNQCVEAVDSYPLGVSYYGAHHMAGNVAEWVADFYDASFYTPNYIVNPEQTVDQMTGRSVRGGSYKQGLEFGRTSNRAQPAFLDAEEIGFRCAQ